MTVPSPELCLELAQQRPSPTKEHVMTRCYDFAARHVGHTFAPIHLQGSLSIDEEGNRIPYRPRGWYVLWAGHLDDMEDADATAF